MASKLKQKPGRRLLTSQQVADRLGISRMTVHRMVRRGELSCYRIGRRRIIRMPEAALEQYLRARWTGPHAPGDDPSGNVDSVENG